MKTTKEAMGELEAQRAGAIEIARTAIGAIETPMEELTLLSFSRNDLLTEWHNEGKPEIMGKHVATHPKTCKRIVAELEAKGMEEAAS